MTASSPQDPRLDPVGMRQAAPNVSKLRFYSIGIVAANKPLQSKVIEAMPTEEIPMMDGYLDSQQDTQTATGERDDGTSYNSTLQMANAIKAEWLPFGDANRLTAPDVRRGEAVILYQFGDADKYYWTTLKNDNRLRKLETVIYAFSGTKDEAADLDASNSYFLEISTHTKTVTFHTSQADGEPYGYDVQINTKEGRVIIVDTAGNKILLDSPATQLRMENAVGAFLDITKQIATITTGEKVEINSPDVVVNSTTTTVNGSSRITLATPDLRSP